MNPLYKCGCEPFSRYDTITDEEKLQKISDDMEEIDNEIDDYKSTHNRLSTVYNYGKEESFPVFKKKSKDDVLQEDLKIMLTYHKSSNMAAMLTVSILAVASIYIIAKY